jgi:ubiquinone/menaquinone biosynthesis C-methylase UbiE
VTHFVWDARQGLEVQDRQNRLSGVRDAKRRAADLLAEADRVVDVGCGTGLDLHTLGRFAVGVDSSAEMLALVHQRGGIGVRSSAQRLALRGSSCDGVRIDRVLYHLENPEAAISDAARVLRPGGRLVCTHPDYESLVLEVPGAPVHLVAAAKRCRIEFNYRDSTVPRRVPRLMLDAGFVEVTTEAFVFVTDDPDEPSLSVPSWLESSTRRGDLELDDAELGAWDRAIGEARLNGGYLAAITYLLTHALKA